MMNCMLSPPVRGAYVDSKGVRWDTNEADFEGYLTKQSKWMKEWRRRYFVLKGSKMFFGKEQYTPPHGMIDLVDCLSAKSADKKAKKRHALEIVIGNTRADSHGQGHGSGSSGHGSSGGAAGEVFLLCASSEREKDDWITSISRAIIKHSCLYVPSFQEEDEDEDVDQPAGPEPALMSSHAHFRPPARVVTPVGGGAHVAASSGNSAQVYGGGSGAADATVLDLGGLGGGVFREYRGDDDDDD